MDAAATRPLSIDRRASKRQYEPLLPEFFPVKLIGAFISVDFVVGCPFDCAFCISRRHPAREALFDARVALDTRVSPRKVLAWLRSMPSYLAGVQIRLGHDTDAGCAFEKSADLIELVDPGRSIVYLTRRPFRAAERTFFARPRANVLLKLTATPRSATLGVRPDPLELVHSAEGLNPRRLHWVVGPLAGDSLPDAERIIDALPQGSRITLKPLNPLGLPDLQAVPALPTKALLGLERRAQGRRLVVTEWFCRNGLAEVGRGFFDVDKITGQLDLGRRALDLVTCVECPSRMQCHTELDAEAFEHRLARELRTLGLTLAAPPERTGPRSFTLHVAEPSSRGDETYLNHAVGQPVSITLSTRERGRSEGGSFCNVDAAVLRRWWAHGFLPVSELNVAAENVLGDLRRLLGDRLPGALRRGSPADPACQRRP
jgi:hypothetical protein